ncbi:glycoside hydrolase family 57 protein [Prochlorococcus marinus]|uniref:1,4-alpha-glucan branching enzyme n=1 Tax=Prochlorococcus marinus (strain MIT 9211) TaxID=93059 RepID=A9BB44_PROM4|nr:1,4-alpha-glucan branching protein domain-containing protein [Prochlorococcus marinus]ABX09056.1 Conserved hypothetical protein [Prochlorococcus marinus str. MIT 9211]
MTKGKLALVLHAHLPYVRSANPGSLEEDWFFQALLECYLPLLEVIENSVNSNEQNPKITISLSPTLLSLLSDQDLKNRFPDWVKLRLSLLEKSTKSQNEAGRFLKKNIIKQLKNWSSCDGEIIDRFSQLEKLKALDLMTCAATHGYLPLLRETPEAVKGQLKTAIREHQRFFGKKPKGIWLPECAYYEGLDHLMRECDLRYSVLDGHGILHGKPRPKYGIYAPVCTKNGIAFFARDSESTLPVWSAREGYPGNPEYREFHKDLGWDIPFEELAKLGLEGNRPLGLKLHKVTSKQSIREKDLYDPTSASKQVKEDAKDYLIGRKKQLIKLIDQTGINPLLIAPFDAELFGHWWFEGPMFLAEIFKQAKNHKVQFTTLKDYLSSKKELQLCEPCPSSWGQGGFHNYWLNETNAWVVNEWSKAGKAMVECCSNGVSNQLNLRILQQAGRELLLAQSSDWSFILKAGTTTELAKERIHRHLNRFWNLMQAIESKNGMSESELKELELEDSIFPLIHANDWYQIY